MISVVIPLYNKEKSIAATLNTVLNQTFQDFEIIVVNDGSTDNGPEIVRNLDNPKIRVIDKENGGVSSARNRGIEEAKGEWVAFLDGDDEWKPEFLETLHQLRINYPKASVCCTNYEMHTSQGIVIPTVINRVTFANEGYLENYFEVAANSNPPICSISLMVKKDALKAIGGFPLGIKSGEDLLTWARLAARYKIAYCRKALAVFNVEGYDRNEKPKREPAEDDIVGRELRKLKAEFAPPMIDHYIALWHKMRSVIYLRLGQSSKGFNEATKAIACNPLNKEMWMLAVLNLLPSKIQRGILSRI